MLNDIEITVKDKDHIHTFHSGVKAYIFHTGIYDCVLTVFGIDGLLEYVELVFDCYIADDNSTNVGALADYIAENYLSVKELSPRAVPDKYYIEGEH